MSKIHIGLGGPAMVGCHLIADLLNSELAPTINPLIGHSSRGKGPVNELEK